MCLSFDYTAAAADTAEDALKNHSATKCSTQACFLITRSLSVETFYRCAIESPTAVMAMFPVKRRDAEALAPCDKVPCCATDLTGWMNPESYVPKVEYVQYRSLGGGDDGMEPPIKMPPGRCVANLYGSLTFVLNTSDVLLDDTDIAKLYASRESYLQKVGKACMSDLVRGLVSRGVPLAHVFELCGDVDPANPIAAIDPIAYVNFLDELLPNLSPGHDMLVCIPPFDEEGRLKMKGSFSFKFKYPTFPKTLPFLGAVHNDTEVATHEVEGDFFVFSNFPLKLQVVDGHTRLECDLLSQEQCRPVDPYDFRYQHACTTFQSAREKVIWTRMQEEMTLPAFDDTRLFATNLVGQHLPRYATEFACAPLVVPVSSDDVKARMKRARDW